jgi:hypothetical protein
MIAPEIELEYGDASKEPTEEESEKADELKFEAADAFFEGNYSGKWNELYNDQY